MGGFEASPITVPFVRIKNVRHDTATVSGTDLITEVIITSGDAM